MDAQWKQAWSSFLDWKTLQSTITKAELHQTSHWHTDKQTWVQNNRYKSRSCCRCRLRWGPTSHWVFVGTCLGKERHALVTNQQGNIVVLCYNTEDWCISCSAEWHCHCSCLSNVLSENGKFLRCEEEDIPFPSSHPLCLHLFHCKMEGGLSHIKRKQPVWSHIIFYL